MFGSRENELLRKALALYAGDHVLKHVLQNGERALQIEAKTLDLTAMFVDIVASFSEIRADLTPDDLQRFMTSWLETVTSSILGHGGTLDVYVGDAVSAWWGANGEKDHARTAVSCAKDLVARIEKLNATSQGNGLPQLRLGVGIASGPIRLGAYGSSKRLRYSMLGDTVNLASRLCGLSSEHAVLIAESTQRRLGDCTSVTRVDIVRIKGIDEPVQLFTV